MPTIGIYVSEQTAEKVTAIANENYRGKKSAFLAEIVETYLSGGTPSTTNLDPALPVSDLIDRYLPLSKKAYDKAVADHLPGTNRSEHEPYMLQNFLTSCVALIEHQDALDFIVAGGNQLAERLGAHYTPEATQEILDRICGKPVHIRAVAEEQATYNPSKPNADVQSAS